MAGDRTFAQVSAENAALRAELAKVKRDQKTASSDAEWADAWSKVEAEEAQTKERQQAALDLMSNGFRTVPCNCHISTRSFLERYGTGKCFHCSESFEDFRLFDEHTKKHHENA